MRPSTFQPGGEKYYRALFLPSIESGIVAGFSPGARKHAPVAQNWANHVEPKIGVWNTDSGGAEGLLARKKPTLSFSIGKEFRQ
jgi:hypothetical protein